MKDRPTAMSAKTQNLAFMLAIMGTPAAATAQAPRFRVEEATIAEVHAAFQSGLLTCRGLVTEYLARINDFDKRGPAINAIITVNAHALAEADSLDGVFKRRGPLGSLHCVPMIVKDNFTTAGIQTTAGSLALQGFIPERDAFQVKRVREAGAIVLAKSNMDEFAWSPYETVSSILPGYTKNPYALDRVTAGSSGGTAAAVAASFGLVGLGTDTGNSIRGPSSHQALVGIRSTIGLTSRAGVVPLGLTFDIAGPMARTVADAVRVFQVVAGADPDDPVTGAIKDHPIPDYSTSLVRGGLTGARIGVLHQAYDTPTTDPEIRALFARALADLAAQGAVIVDPATVEGFDRLPSDDDGCLGFKADLNRFLAAQGDRVPVKTLKEILASGKFHPSIGPAMRRAEADDRIPATDPACRNDWVARRTLGLAVTTLMDRERLDALVYPTWSNPPRLIGDLNTPPGDNNQVFSPVTGFPAMTVPMGYTRGGTLPAGLQFFGRGWDEARLIKLAYDYEQATRHRKAPAILAGEPTFIAIYWKARPGKEAEYEEYIRRVAKPIDDEAERAGAFEELRTYVPAERNGPWTHLRVFRLRDQAQVDAFSAAMDAAGTRLYPDPTKRPKADDLRDLVKREMWRGFP